MAIESESKDAPSPCAKCGVSTRIRLRPFPFRDLYAIILMISLYAGLSCTLSLRKGIHDIVMAIMFGAAPVCYLIGHVVCFGWVLTCRRCGRELPIPGWLDVKDPRPTRGLQSLSIITLALGLLLQILR